MSWELFTVGRLCGIQDGGKYQSDYEENLSKVHGSALVLLIRIDSRLLAGRCFMQVRRRKLLRHSGRDSALFYNGVGTTRRGEWFLTAEKSFPEYLIEVQAVDFPSTCKIKAKSYRF
jgi:hypothetical protein